MASEPSRVLEVGKRTSSTRMEVILVIVAVKCNGVKSVVPATDHCTPSEVEITAPASRTDAAVLPSLQAVAPVSIVVVLRLCAHCLIVSCAQGCVFCCVAIITRSFKFINKIQFYI